ncbi:hypothetical protein MKZ38_002298 [Zalerion maritima]|uniref:Uncharacterized protein n=1 Tax=Zalerion maritima TaxID=339359 RepID=A0AAD5WRC9_9PEZI|nr:hypothetical protein MKZ38_002298 [Zalerion maritima]
MANGTYPSPAYMSQPHPTKYGYSLDSIPQLRRNSTSIGPTFSPALTTQASFTTPCNAAGLLPSSTAPAHHLLTMEWTDALRDSIAEAGFDGLCNLIIDGIPGMNKWEETINPPGVIFWYDGNYHPDNSSDMIADMIHKKRGAEFNVEFKLLASVLTESREES